MAAHSLHTAHIMQQRTVGHVISWEKSAQLHLLSWNTTSSPQLRIRLLSTLLLCKGSCFSQQLCFLDLVFAVGAGRKTEMCLSQVDFRAAGRLSLCAATLWHHLPNPRLVQHAQLHNPLASGGSHPYNSCKALQLVPGRGKFCTNLLKELQ